MKKQPKTQKNTQRLSKSSRGKKPKTPTTGPENKKSSLLSMGCSSCLTLVGIFIVFNLLLFAVSSAYLFFFPEPANAQAGGYQESQIYYYTVDHVGRPFNLRDQSRNLRWHESHYPFGETINEQTPNGPMYAGSGQYETSWKPSFRFPGQYGEADQFPFVQNRNREYLPEFGIYSRPDPIQGTTRCRGVPTYAYANGNPLIFTDPSGKFGQGPGCTLDDVKMINIANNAMRNTLLKPSCECSNAMREKHISVANVIDRVNNSEISCLDNEWCGTGSGGKINLTPCAIAGGLTGGQRCNGGRTTCGCLQATLFEEGIHLTGITHTTSLYDLDKVVTACFPCGRENRR